MQELCGICGEIARIISGLAGGSVAYVYDNFIPQGGKTNPAEILEDIFCGIADRLYEDPDTFICPEEVASMLKALKAFRRCFRVSELLQPIARLEAYLRQPRLAAAA